MTRKLKGNELHPVYSRYRAIISRCRDVNHASYSNYGGRGIDIANDLTPFTNFRDYVVSLENYAPDNLTLDRIDNEKGYEKGNLRWVCRSTQTANQISSGKGNNKFTGVNWSKTHQRWVARVNFKGKTIFTKTCKCQKEALEARNKFIIDNDLPHTINNWLDDSSESATTIPAGSRIK